MCYFNMHAKIVCTNILVNISWYLGLPIVLEDQSQCFPPTFISSYFGVMCYMSSLPILKIHFYSNRVIITSLRQACLLWWPSFLQHVSMALIQQSGYSVFYDRDIPIDFYLPW